MYIGYAICLETAFTIFGYDQHVDHEESHYTTLTAYLKTHDLDLYFYDKNVYILGKRVDEFHAGNDTHYSVIDAIEVMITYKNKVTVALEAAGANLAEFDIEVMEGEPTKVRNPVPYVIT